MWLRQLGVGAALGVLILAASACGADPVQPHVLITISERVHCWTYLTVDTISGATLVAGHGPASTTEYEADADSGEAILVNAQGTMFTLHWDAQGVRVDGTPIELGESLNVTIGTDGSVRPGTFIRTFD